MTAPQKPVSPSGAMIRIMGVVSLICGLLIVITDSSTLQAINRNQQIILQEAVAELLPGVKKQVIYSVAPNGSLSIATGVQGTEPRIFAGFDSSNRLIGVVLEASERGYADVIRTMYAYSPANQAIVGFKVVEMKETPGLGDKIITDPAFLANFRQLEAKLDDAKQKLLHAIVTVKHGTKKNAWEVDAISGATISSRAVGRALNKSAQGMLPIVTRNLARIERGE